MAPESHIESEAGSKTNTRVCSEPTHGEFTVRTQYEKDHAVKLLWVDAICINQDDLVERGRQVTMMGRILALCKNLVIWLGEPGTGALGIAQSQLFRQQKNNDHDAVAALLSILRRPWFKRRWVIQEAAPPDVAGFVMVGDLQYPRWGFQSQLEYHDLLTEANPLVSFTRATPDRSLLQTLYIYDESQCEDPRDRIFALKDLSNHRDRIQVDYNRHARDVYLDLARKVVLGTIHGEELLSRASEVQVWPRDPQQAVAMLAISTCKRRTVVSERSFNM